MRFSLATLSLLPAYAAAITITGPSSSLFWVADTSNNITWTFDAGDPNPISIIVTNTNNVTLNGDFSIAEFVNVSALTFTVTNVTLLPGSGYQVVFVNSTNTTQVFANSTDFEVKPNGTAPAVVSTSASGTATSGSSGSATGSGSSSSASSTSASASSSSSSAMTRTAFDVRGMLYAAGACGITALAGLVL